MEMPRAEPASSADDGEPPGTVAVEEDEPERHFAEGDGDDGVRPPDASSRQGGAASAAKPGDRVFKFAPMPGISTAT